MFTLCGDEMSLFFSSDKRKPTQSYDGSDAYHVKLQLSNRKVVSEIMLSEAGSQLLLLHAIELKQALNVVGIRSFSNNPSLVEALIDMPSPK